MSALFEFFALLVKRVFIAALLLGGLLLGLLIAIKVLLVMLILRLFRGAARPSVARPAQGNVIEGEFSVVSPPHNRATILMATPVKSAPRAP
jgi:hypothetical protein